LLGVGANFTKMYEEKELVAKQDKNEAMAEEMANAICSNSPDVQNRMLKQIHSIVKERRQIMIDEADKNAAWLKETMQQL